MSEQSASRPPRRLIVLGAGAAALVLLLAVLVGYAARRIGADEPAGTAAATASQAPAGRATPVSGLATIAAADLPKQARDTLVLIDKKGPFPYSRDGIVFGNNEKILPARARGYYHEYTVPTPGEQDRGARRLVVGDQGDVYYTDDHYDSFRQVLR
ncbi:ribonuclease T1 [Allocatelliglobosispora scoriae]|uniref:Ribonuclease T1 n=1 Tax=Allocatelliglobosispora scoriae TaxID=643052 RepID=A0A841BP22_9ACTN|nr:ribonuclease domain-containing protein [Allocatelliglobosispora scoriae]MBB5869415.1 ribonuclease T1 [Allocatelliglobosispora scoriae]